MADVRVIPNAIESAEYGYQANGCHGDMREAPQVNQPVSTSVEAQDADEYQAPNSIESIAY
jgi:hypothetical protein